MLSSSDEGTSPDRSRPAASMGTVRGHRRRRGDRGGGPVVLTGGGDDDDAGGGGGPPRPPQPGPPVTSDDLRRACCSFSVAEAEGHRRRLARHVRHRARPGRLPQLLRARVLRPVRGRQRRGHRPGRHRGQHQAGLVPAARHRPDHRLHQRGHLERRHRRRPGEGDLEGFNEFFAHFAESYGRTVDLEFYEAPGTADDEVAARADAVAIAEDLQPFAVLNGPQLTSAFEEELAARGVVCISAAPPSRSRSTRRPTPTSSPSP